MRLLIVTQKVNKRDPILGFFHRWIVEFAKNYEAVTVICLEEGEHELSQNVKVISLGKEKELSVVSGQLSVKSQKSKVGRKMEYIFRFYKYIWQEKGNYDVVFVHMNPIYVVLGGFVWKVLGKKISLWYTHKNVDLKLKVAELFVDNIFTASKESFKLKSGKVLVTGHGIDVNIFADMERSKFIGTEPISILSVGRITPIKNCDILIEAVNVLKKQWNKKFEITFIGSPVTTGDKVYKEKLVALISRYSLEGETHFIGDISPAQMPEYYADSDATINLAPTGGVDKVVLESMAAGVPAFVANETFREYFCTHADVLMFKEGDADDLAAKIMKFFAGNGVAQVGADLQKVAREKADVGVLVRTIFDIAECQ
jgi:glycosyltransferase involved in cell wall biosynthesis